MFNTSDVAAACGVDPATVRSWLARAPGFAIGHSEASGRTFDDSEALVLVIAGELLALGFGPPHLALPVARHISRMAHSDRVWVSRGADGSLTASAHEPAEVAVALPLPALAARLTRQLGSPMRVGRVTR